MKKKIAGKVVSDKMDKTRVVEVVRSVRHPIYKKQYKVSKRFYAHDESNRTKIGDLVVIEEARPLSRLKRWIIVSAQVASALGGPLPDSAKTLNGKAIDSEPSLKKKQGLKAIQHRSR